MKEGGDARVKEGGDARVKGWGGGRGREGEGGGGVSMRINAKMWCSELPGCSAALSFSALFSLFYWPGIDKPICGKTSLIACFSPLHSVLAAAFFFPFLVPINASRVLEN